MSDGDEMRFSDEMLNEFYQKFRHHVDAFEEHKKHESELITAILTGQKENAAAIKEMARDSRDMVDAWNGAQQVVKVGGVLGRFGKWLASVAIIGAAFKWIVDNWG